MMWIAACMCLMVLALLYYWRTAALKPELIYQENAANRHILDRLPRLQRLLRLLELRQALRVLVRVRASPKFESNPEQGYESKGP